MAQDCRDGVRSHADYVHNGWVRNRTLQVRYEDIALDPLSHAKMIYNFVGLEFNSAIKKRFEDATNRMRRRRSAQVRFGPASLSSNALHPRRNNGRVTQRKSHKIDMYGTTKSKDHDALLEGMALALK